MKQTKWLFLCLIPLVFFSNCSRRGHVIQVYEGEYTTLGYLENSNYSDINSRKTTSLMLVGDSVEYETNGRNDDKKVEEKKIVYKAKLSLAVTKNVDSSISEITKLVSLHNGFIQQSSSSSIEIKVPPQQLNTLINAVVR